MTHHSDDGDSFRVIPPEQAAARATDELRHARLTDSELTFVQELQAAFDHYRTCPLVPVIGRLHEGTPIYDGLVLENLQRQHDALQTSLQDRWRATHADLSK